MLADPEPAIDFSRYTEVTITRRLYRDGTSQYFINKTPCRLRDITDFFLGTGVGTKAYAIIEQGRIGQIVSSRPQDRRAIIEEAAGITKFKAKKKAAEKKLDQTRQNLMRVSDIVIELDKRMGTLRRQAQKAERYRKYKAEMRDIELWKAAHRWLELSAEGELVAGRLGEARTELEDARTLWAGKDAHVVAERARARGRGAPAARRSRSRSTSSITGSGSARARSGSSVARPTSSMVGSRWRATEIDRDRGRARARSRGARDAAGRARHARGRGRARGRRGRGARGGGRRSPADGDQRAGPARRGARGARHAAHRDRDGERAARGARAAPRGSCTRRLERVTLETEQHAERVKELERESRRVDSALVELRQTRLDLGSQNQGFEERRELLADETARGEAEVETLRTELQRRTSRLTSLKEIQDRYEGFQRGTRAVMQRADEIGDRVSGDDIRGVVADVVRAPEMLEVAVEAALGDRLGGVLVSRARGRHRGDRLPQAGRRRTQRVRAAPARGCGGRADVGGAAGPRGPWTV